nr:centromere protein X isoform X1 [Dromaius novaehollandiae]
MEERDGGAGGFRKETVDRLLRLHFRDGRTRVNGDALLLTAELLKVFVRGADTAAPLSSRLRSRSSRAGSTAGSGRGPGEGGYRTCGESAATAASRFLETQ